MPVNLVHRLLHRVGDGWDPISREYAESYTAFASNSDGSEVVDKLERISGGLKGKAVLDLGGGPGQFSILFAERGACVTWHDISGEYERIARNRAASRGVEIHFSRGYLEDAKNLGTESFDLVFCRVCWCYSRSDRKFARLIYRLVKPGGVAYIDCNTPAFSKPTGFRLFQHYLNTYFWWKIGHPMPPHGRIAKLLLEYPNSFMELDYRSQLNDIVIFGKSPARNVAGEAREAATTTKQAK